MAICQNCGTQNSDTYIHNVPVGHTLKTFCLLCCQSMGCHKCGTFSSDTYINNIPIGDTLRRLCLECYKIWQKDYDVVIKYKT